jgi:hypothetical protein
MLNKVTRVELITQEGRQYVQWDIRHVSLCLQDEGQTLKIFVEEKEKNEAVD